MSPYRYARCWIRLPKICLLLCTSFMLSGCWSQINLDQLTVVSAVGLDLSDDDTLQVTLQLVNPTLPVAAGGGQQRRSYATYTTQGHTVEEALDKIKQQAKKSVFLPQTRVILIGENFARHGIGGTMDFFLRDPNQNLNSWVLVSSISARETLEHAEELESVPADEWKEYLSSKKRKPLIETVQLYQFLPRLHQVGFQASVSGMFPVSGIKGEEIMRIGETAIFRGDKMVGWLTAEESQVTNWLADGPRAGSIQLNMAEDAFINFNLKNIRTRIQPDLQEDQPVMSIQLRGEAEIVTTTRRLDLTNPKTAAKLEQALNELIRTSVAHTVAKVCGTYKSDIFGFGESLHRKDPKQWKLLKPQWGETIGKLKPKVAVSVQLVKSGLLRDSSSYTEKE
ncbi:Ger(x)C family spore germination protein [Paenibacillus thalictri]|uniref:Ger(X)C family spore germination protein n=1 Tax=Paenibacillus thalictri TaxID=2527873 RepID=A0A4Q9DFM4_9BACL|nr:Ger(x)C family spore germination protein [Paenibacillus thalictri]TBL69672.1 Ger(x)C family spore germination protein [Paenibacillus thalictri]